MMTNERQRAEFEAWANGRHDEMNTHDKIELPEHDCLYETTNEDGFIDLEPAYRKSTVLRLIEAALQSQDREDESCKWHNYPETDNVWDTDCGQSFEIYEGTPTENGMGFCCYCGKPIREAIDHARRIEGEL